MQKIFVLYTGGTIGMKPGPNGLVPDAQLAEQALQPYAEQAVFHWHICQPLIDSSNITPQHWAEWLAILQAALPDCLCLAISHQPAIKALFPQQLDLNRYRAAAL